MKRTSSAIIRRAAAVVLAAAVLPFLTTHAVAQQSVDLFAGALGTPALLSATTPLITTGATQTGTFGPGYGGTVTLGAGAITTLSEGFAPFGASNSFSISQTGLLGLGSSTSASKLLGVSLTPSGVYNLSLTRTAGFTVGLLNNLNIQLSANGTTFLDTSTGQGLAGVVNVLGLFNTNNTATFQFTVPANAIGTLGVNLNTNLGVGALNGAYTFTSASVNQVPEPHTVVAMLLGASGFAVLRVRRRLAAI